MSVMKEKNIVGIAKVKHPQNKSEIKSALFDLLNQIKQRDNVKIPQKADVMIKPNICLVRGYETGVSVDPFIIKCLIDWLLQNYDVKTITIGEADATELNVEVAFKVLGWEDSFNMDFQNHNYRNVFHIQTNSNFFPNHEIYFPPSTQPSKNGALIKQPVDLFLLRHTIILSL